MRQKRARSEGDDQAGRSCSKRQARDRQFVPHQLSSPPPEPSYPYDSTFETSPRFPSLHPLPLGTTPQRLLDSQCKHSTPPLPLTRKNLCDLQRSLRGNSPSMPSSPSRRSRSPEKSTLADRMDPKDKLQLFSIFYDEQTPIPSILEQHVSDLREPRQAPSPNAKRIRDTAPIARSRSEQDGIDTLEEILLLAPASQGGMAGVERAAKPNLSAQFLPLASSFVAENMRLETPQPDHCYGYLPSKKARPAKLKALFTIEEENIMNRFALTTELYFPFFTAQWKSPAKGQTHHQAIPQGARDGSAIVNYLHQFYTIARPTQTPSPIETCHFSATIDMRSIILWVHWREQDEDGNVSYHMEQVEPGILDKERDNEEIRVILRNLQDYALGCRLQGIKELLSAFWNNFAKKGLTRTGSVMSSSSGMENIPALHPPTPSSEALEPTRKRRREEG